MEKLRTRTRNFRPKTNLNADFASLDDFQTSIRRMRSNRTLTIHSIFFIVLLINKEILIAAEKVNSRHKRFVPPFDPQKVFNNVAGVETISNQVTNNINQGIIQIIGYVIGGKNRSFNIF